MKIYQMPDAERYSRMTTEEMRRTFLIENLFSPGKIELVYADVDRTVIGSAVPGAEALQLSGVEDLRCKYFTERRELGILNVGGNGSVRAGDKTVEMDNLDCLYVGKGTEQISFASSEAKTPAQFYLLSYPAHATFPNVLAKKAQAAAVNLGAPETCNKRTIFKYIHPDGIKSCQLVMGFTQLAVGSVWNTMPPHTHMRRSEIYLYFDVANGARVMHFMGPGQETRHLVVANRQAVISPSWSIHAGAGTGSYSFCWGMGGENQVFDDMDAIAIGNLK